MKRFVIKITLFLLPIFILYLYTYVYYSKDEGDLLRLGYIFNSYPTYRDIFKEELKKDRNYDLVSDKSTKTQYKLFTIGDSFSEQGGYGYQNYIGEGDSILHLDRRLHRNPIQTLFSLYNGDFFTHYKFDYIVLQFLERHTIEWAWDVDTTEVMSLKNIQDALVVPAIPQNTNTNFYSDRVIKFPYYSIQYFLRKDYKFPQVYRTELIDTLFSVPTNQFLFYELDIDLLDKTNHIQGVTHLNGLLNLLSQRLEKIGVKLIVMPSPDKYDLYYDYIANKNKYPKPMFFEHMASMKKEYNYVDSKKILSSYLNKKKDLYFYDDTHWSPWSSQIIGNEISKIIAE